MVDLITITFIWMAFFGYIMTAAVDFGAAALLAYARLKPRNRLMDTIQNYLSAPAESVNMLFVLMLIPVLFQLERSVSGYIQALLLPGAIVLIFMVVKAILFISNPGQIRSQTWFIIANGISALLIPAILSTVLVVSEGGFIRTTDGTASLLYQELLTNIYFWSVVFLSVSSVLYIGAAFLWFVEGDRGQKDERISLQTIVLTLSVPTLAASAFVFAAIQRHNVEHFERMLDVSWLFLLSLCCLLAAVTLVFRQSTKALAFIFVYFQFFFAFMGYGVSHLPYILYPTVTVSSTVSQPFILGLVIGAGVLFPALLLFYKVRQTVPK